MDPDAALEKIRSLCRAVSRSRDSDDFIVAAADLVEAVEGLDEWIEKGGALPRAWQGRKPPRPNPALRVMKRTGDWPRADPPHWNR